MNGTKKKQIPLNNRLLVTTKAQSAESDSYWNIKWRGLLGYPVRLIDDPKTPQKGSEQHVMEISQTCRGGHTTIQTGIHRIS